MLFSNTLSKKWLATGCLLTCLCWFTQAQTDTLDVGAPTQIIEETVSNLEEDLENDNIIDDLAYLVAAPININDTLADFLPLLNYGILDEIQAENIRAYVKEYGGLLSKTELLAVNGISYAEVQALQPYISVTDQDVAIVPFGKQLKWGRDILLTRYQTVVEDQEGYLRPDSVNTRYLGDRAKLYLRYRHQFADQLSYGFVAEKDPGEELFSGSNTGFDSYSFHFFKKSNGTLKSLALGDYEVKIGQGLLHWNGFSLGKGVSSSKIYRTAPRIRAFNSANEFNFLRGAAAEFQTGKFILDAWASSKKIDANFGTDTVANRIELVTIKQDGLHRTPNEIEDERVTQLSNAGFNLEYQSKQFNVGVAGSFSKFGDALAGSGRPYQQFDITGDEAYGATVHYSALLKDAYLFGETAVDKDGNMAALHGVQGFLQPGIKATAAVRSYSKAYRSVYSDGLAESTNSQNEEGLYLGVELNPFKKLVIDTYADIFRFPSIRFRVDKPGNGNEFFLRTRYIANSNTELELRSRWEQKPINQSDDVLPINPLGNQQRATNRLELRYRPTNNVYLKTRLEHSHYQLDQEKENGFIAFQDVIYQVPAMPVKLYSRLAVFNTDSFNTRIYAFENDLLYNFNVPAYSGQGTRWYAMVNYKPSRKLAFWLRYAQTSFSDREVVSSGLNESIGNTRSDVRTQLVWKF